MKIHHVEELLKRSMSVKLSRETVAIIITLFLTYRAIEAVKKLAQSRHMHRSVSELACHLSHVALYQFPVVYFQEVPVSFA